MRKSDVGIKQKDAVSGETNGDAHRLSQKKKKGI